MFGFLKRREYAACEKVLAQTVASYPTNLKETLLRFRNGEVFTVGDSFENISITGGPGSGKTSGSGFAFALAMLRKKYGVLVLTAKVDEVLRWKKLAQLAGRENDLVIFDSESGHKFNFLNYLATRQPPEVGLSGTLVYLLEELAEVVERMSGLRVSRGDEQFWSQGRRLHASSAIDLSLLTLGETSIPFINTILRDAPRSLDEIENPVWQACSGTFRLLQRVDRDKLSPAALEDLLEVEHYFMVSFPRLAEKTRSVIEASLSGVLQLFARGTLRRLFCEETTISPDDIIRDGRIVVVNLPIKKFLGIGLVAQTIWKAAFQQRAEQRTPDEQRPCLLYMDEAQTLLTRRDTEFAATARSSRVSNLWLTQNISNLYMVTGGDETGKAAADSLLGLAMTKIFHNNSDPVTAQWASDLIGKRKVKMRSTSLAHSPPVLGSLFQQPPQITSTSNESYEYVVNPYEFSMLRKGGMPHMKTEAIVYQSGRKWVSTGESFCRMDFEQGF